MSVRHLESLSKLPEPRCPLEKDIKIRIAPTSLGIAKGRGRQQRNVHRGRKDHKGRCPLLVDQIILWSHMVKKQSGQMHSRDGGGEAPSSDIQEGAMVRDPLTHSLFFTESVASHLLRPPFT